MGSKSLTLLLAPLHALLLTLVLGGEAGESLAHLLLYILLVHLGVHRTLVAVLSAAAVIPAAVCAATVPASVIAASVVAATAIVIVAWLVAGLFDIHLLLSADALTLLAVIAVTAGCIPCTLRSLTLAVAGTAFLLGLLLRTGRLVESGKVDMPYHLRTCHLRFRTVAEQLRLSRSRCGSWCSSRCRLLILLLWSRSLRCLCLGSRSLLLRLGSFRSMLRLRCLGWLLRFHWLLRPGGFHFLCLRGFRLGCLSFRCLGGLLRHGRLHFLCLRGFRLRSLSFRSLLFLRLGYYRIILGVKLYLAYHPRPLRRGSHLSNGISLRSCGDNRLSLVLLLVLTHPFDTLTLLTVRLESLYKYVVGSFVDTCVRVGIYRDALLLQLLHNRRDGDIEFFGGLTNFYSRHIIF